MEGSQASLPKSHTLPREFKYTNDNNPRERRVYVSKPYNSRFPQPSNNSSDGKFSFSWMLFEKINALLPVERYFYMCGHDFLIGAFGDYKYITSSIAPLWISKFLFEHAVQTFKNTVDPLPSSGKINKR